MCSVWVGVLQNPSWDPVGVCKMLHRMAIHWSECDSQAPKTFQRDLTMAGAISRARPAAPGEL